MPTVTLHRKHRGPTVTASTWGSDPATVIMKAMRETATYSEAAARLGISESTFYRYLHRYDIKPVWDATRGELVFDR